jgi:hypothetical protein
MAHVHNITVGSRKLLTLNTNTTQNFKCVASIENVYHADVDGRKLQSTWMLVQELLLPGWGGGGEVRHRQHELLNKRI